MRSGGTDIQVGHPPEKAAFLVAERTTIRRRINQPLAFCRAHVAHAAESAPQHGLPVRRQTAELGKHVPGMLSLLRIQALKGIHAMQNTILLFGGQAVEVFQTLPKLLLSLRG
jgi:hypothetical protein